MVSVWAGGVLAFFVSVGMRVYQGTLLGVPFVRHMLAGQHAVQVTRNVSSPLSISASARACCISNATSQDDDDVELECDF